jgi:molybdopterin synthase sulfur carrier subunit
MLVVVKLYATLAAYHLDSTSGVPFKVVIHENSSIQDLVEKLNLPSNEVKLFFVNGRLQLAEYLLKNNDEVGIFPPIGGG